MNIANNNYMKIVYVVMVSAIVLSQNLDSYRRTTVSNLEYHQREDGYSAHYFGNSGGIYPYGTGPVIYLDGVLVGGFQNEQLKVTGSIYRNGLVNGTIQNGQLNQNSSTRIFKIRKNSPNLTDEQLNQEVMQSTGKCNCVVERQNKGIIAIEEYSSWPDSSILVDGTTDSHLAPSLSQTGNIWDNRAGDINLPSNARDYDQYDLWDMDDVVIDFGDSSLSWEYYSGWLHTDSIDGSATFGEPVYQPFAAYRIKYSTGDTLRLFAGFWDTNGDGHWSVNSEVDETGETVFDWVCPTYGSEAWEPIYLIQGYDTDGNEVSYDPAQEATYIQMALEPTAEQEGFDGLNLASNSTWGNAAGDFNYPFMTAALLGAYYGPNEAGSYVEGSPEGATSSLPQAGHYDKFGNVLTVDHYYKFSTAKGNTVDDIFEFTTTAPTASDELKATDLDMINVFPNPYYASNSQETNRFDHFVTFNHLPDDQTDVTIKIYSIDGVLVRKLESMANENQYMQWDLRNNSNLPVASGPYVAHVNTAHGERILKLYIVQRNQVVQYY